jgi:hypothetical protein
MGYHFAVVCVVLRDLDSSHQSDWTIQASLWWISATVVSRLELTLSNRTRNGLGKDVLPG